MTPTRPGSGSWQSTVSGTSPKLVNAMEAAIAGAAEVGRVGRRIFHKLWDPEPVNDRQANEPAWCLGCSYTLDTKTYGPLHLPDSSSSSITTATAPAPAPATTIPISILAPSAEAGAEAETATDKVFDIITATEAAPGPPPPAPSPAVGDKAVAAAAAAAPHRGLAITSSTTTTTTTADTDTDASPESVTSSFDSSLAYEEPGSDGGWPPAFLDDFESRIWMTYRTSFEVIPRSTDPRASTALSFAMRLKTTFADSTAGFTADTGWGCMIRSGQSLLANAILIARYGRDWRRGTDPDAERSVLQLFADDSRAPYSLHSFVQHGAVACSKYPGEWFGPSAASRCIQALANKHETSLRVYSTGDLPDVYEDSFMAVADPDGQGFQPTLILVCTRLGIDKINHVYEEALISTLQMPQSIGIAGGRPSSSHYFVGAQGQWLFYLDPHHPRPALPYHEDPKDYTIEELDTCHTRRLRSLHVEDMDPSMLIGFLIKDEDDWDTWKSAVKHVQGKSIITVSPHDPERGMGSTRAAAIDEVESCDDEDEDDDADTILDV